MGLRWRTVCRGRECHPYFVRSLYPPSVTADLGMYKFIQLATRDLCGYIVVERMPSLITSGEGPIIVRGPTVFVDRRYCGLIGILQGPYDQR